MGGFFKNFFEVAKETAAGETSAATQNPKATSAQADAAEDPKAATAPAAATEDPKAAAQDSPATAGRPSTEAPDAPEETAVKTSPHKGEEPKKGLYSSLKDNITEVKNNIGEAVNELLEDAGVGEDPIESDLESDFESDLEPDIEPDLESDLESELESDSSELEPDLVPDSSAPAEEPQPEPTPAEEPLEPKPEKPKQRPYKSTADAECPPDIHVKALDLVIDMFVYQMSVNSQAATLALAGLYDQYIGRRQEQEKDAELVRLSKIAADFEIKLIETEKAAKLLQGEAEDLHQQLDAATGEVAELRSQLEEADTLRQQLDVSKSAELRSQDEVKELKDQLYQADAQIVGLTRKKGELESDLALALEEARESAELRAALEEMRLSQANEQPVKLRAESTESAESAEVATPAAPTAVAAGPEDDIPEMPPTPPFALRRVIVAEKAATQASNGSAPEPIIAFVDPTTGFAYTFGEFTEMGSPEEFIMQKRWIRPDGVISNFVVDGWIAEMMDQRMTPAKIRAAHSDEYCQAAQAALSRMNGKR